MQIKQLKKELGITNADLAEFFGLGERAYYYSSARKRYEESFIRIYEFLKVDEPLNLEVKIVEKDKS